MTPEQKEILTKQARIGRNAKIAYDAYFKEYYTSARETLFEAFSNGSNNTEELLQIKLSLASINALNDGILSDIKIGEIAKQQLENEN